ncbi:MAG: gliding motility-associated C-terminal domain-containing protein, partial [Bacteroidetes bacterium]|nr:gliding motility-associated C-terminal domain-containing protein [Bacteroidota bacterium]
PNVITANNDGTNDELNIHENFKTCEEYTLYIFNRWGNLVFEQTLYSPQFRGETTTGDILEGGVYFYKLIVHDADQDKSVKHGYIHVIR